MFLPTEIFRPTRGDTCSCSPQCNVTRSSMLQGVSICSICYSHCAERCFQGGTANTAHEYEQLEIIESDTMDLTCSDGVGGRPAANNERRPPPRAIIARVLWICARCVHKSAASANHRHRAGRRQPAAGQARSICGPQGQANSPHHRFRSVVYAIDHEQVPNCLPDPPLFRAPRRLAAAWSPCVADAAPCCCCFAHDRCLLSAVLSSAATHSPRPTLDQVATSSRLLTSCDSRLAT
jgi:hypothetical protein